MPDTKELVFIAVFKKLKKQVEDALSSLQETHTKLVQNLQDTHTDLIQKIDEKLAGIENGKDGYTPTNEEPAPKVRSIGN